MRKSPWKARVEIGLLLFLIALFIIALVDTKNLSSDGRQFPLVVTGIGLPVLLGTLAQTLWQIRQGVWAVPAQAGAVAQDALAAADEAMTQSEDSAVLTEQLRDPSSAQGDAEQPPATIWRSIRFWAWFGAFCAALSGFGFYVGVPVISGLFVAVDARKSLWKAVLTGVVTWVFMYGVFTRGFGIIWPSGYFLQ